MEQENKPKYYTEEIEKDTRYRQDYVDGANRFFYEQYNQAAGPRDQFITPEQYKANPEYYREALKQMLGFPLNLPTETPTLAEKTFVAQDGNVNIYRMQLTFFGYLKFYGIYFEQINKAKDTPFVLSFHGGWGTPELVSSIYMDSGNYLHQTRRMCERGANVFAPQLMLWDVSNFGNPHDRIHMDGKMRQLDGSMTALEVYLLMGTISYFIESGEAPEDRIGVVGLSYGGMYAIHLAAVDPRVKACYSCSWFNRAFDHSWADWSYRNAAKTFTSVETAAMIAPRALFITMGDNDNLFAAATTEEEYKRLEPYYQIFDAADQCKLRIFPGVHEQDKEDYGFDFLINHL
ncbi:MAG: dienelactone hydrolase family protein [Clostridia bacterium]|nr:dienelactone hydrolase family protein [Clostridia bacterium]